MGEAIVVGVCLALNALLAAYEMAFVSVPRSELRALLRAGNKNAQRLIQLREKPERTLSIIQIGITAVGAIAAAVGGAGAGDSLEPYLIAKYGLSNRIAEVLALMIVVIPITYLSVVVGELVPKTLALRNPARIVLAGAKTLFVLDRILSPVITALEWSTRKIIKIFFPRSKVVPPTENTTIEIDALSPLHQKFMLNMAGIERKQIQDILLPWAQVVAIEDNTAVEQVLQIILSSGHTRLPVNHKGKVIGILHTKEFIALKESGEQHWQAILRPTVLVKPTDSALGVMRLLQDQRNHMAVVASAGERLGIVTMEDILEEVVGDIFDEDDDGRIRKVYEARAKGRVVPREG